jgi:hypothetical protein
MCFSVAILSWRLRGHHLRSLSIIPSRELLKTRHICVSYLELVLRAPTTSPGWLPSTGEVPFQIAGDERMISMYSHHFDDGVCVTFLIPTKALLRQIESLPIKEGLDVEWEAYGLQLLEYVPEHPKWIVPWPYFIFGMRYLLPRVAYFGGKRNVIFRDFSPRRCLMASEEEREESNALEEAIKELKAPSHQVTASGKPYPYSILKCLPLPEGIGRWIRMLFLSEDGIVVVEEVRD